MSYLGDFKEDGDLFHKFTTRAFATGIPTTLAGSPVLSVYKDEGGAASEKTTAESYFDLDVDHDSIVGWHNVRIDLAGDAFFATGADYMVVITAGTVGGVNVFGENVFTFSIENRSMGQPAGATLAADIAALKTVADAIPTTTMRGTDNANTTTPPTVVQNRAEMDSNSTQLAALIAAIITNAAGVDIAADIIALKTVADAIPTTVMRGTDNAALASICTEGRLAELAAANLPTDIAAVKTVVDGIPTTAMRGTDSANTVVPATKAQMDTAHALLSTPAKILTTALIESYVADGSPGTLTQLLMEIRALLGEFAISGTTLTTKKVNGLTTANTYTLDDASNPTSITKAT